MSELNTNRDELESRLLDQALDEIIGGKTPPDLSQKILPAVQPVKTVSWRRWTKYALAASLLIAVSVALLLPAMQPAREAWRGAAARDADDVMTFTLDGPGTHQIGPPQVYSGNATVKSPAAASSEGFERYDPLSTASENRNWEEAKQNSGQPMSPERGASPTVHDPAGPIPASNNPFSRRAVGGVVSGGENSGGMMPGGGMGVGGGFGGGMQGGAAGYAPGGSGMGVGMGGMPGAGMSEGGRMSGGGMEMGGMGGGSGGMPESARTFIDPQTGKQVEYTIGKPVQPTGLSPVPGQEAEFAEQKAKIEQVVSGVAGITNTPNHPNDLYNVQGQGPGQAGDRHSRIVENPFLAVGDNPLSTFSIDVDTASYSKTRRFLLDTNTLPPPDAVRIEELVNYFSYDYAPPQDNSPFAAHVEVAACPWKPEHRLVRIGLKGKEVARDQRPAGNLVFLLDVSGSMRPEDRLPRVVRSMKMLVKQLTENDSVAIVVYAGASGLVLPSTPGYEQAKILQALDGLHSGGSTNGGEGIRLAYDTALASFIRGGTNRVILCTDGDFNVGTTDTAELERLVEEKAKSNVFLTVLGYGMGNHNDDMLEKLADKGNGNYGYIDTEEEARKLLVEQLGGTLVTIAKDVKIQIEFNPQQVRAYRLLGYENRMLRAEDFNDDTKDAGEIGAGHTVTALYEIAPPAAEVKTPDVDALKYQRPAAPTDAATNDELLTLKLRYKEPDGQESKAPLIFPVTDSKHSFGQASPDFKFAASVAGFGMLLRNSAYKGNLTYDAVLEVAQEGLGEDRHGYRAGFLDLVRKAKSLTP